MGKKLIATDFDGGAGAEAKSAEAAEAAAAAAAAVEKQRGGTSEGEQGVPDEEWDSWLKDLFGKK